MTVLGGKLLAVLHFTCNGWPTSTTYVLLLPEGGGFRNRLGVAENKYITKILLHMISHTYYVAVMKLL